ncbi:MAG TPA: alkaline phosphatase family protein, partial [Rhizomicrobium sp.]|nr:alkaline phosphatase family protein [Rhizomicrobium sp.]
LGTVLPQDGALLTDYYGIGHASLDNYIAMISGQPPNEDTQRDCPVFAEFALTSPVLDSQGRALGHGCVYPAMVKTLPDQLEAKGLSWRGYMEDMGKDPTREAATCAHSPVGAKETLNHATKTDQYAGKHDPFVYFHTIIDNQARCDAHVVPLSDLPTDLAQISTTPNFAYITPNLCNDGHDQPCIDGSQGGYAPIDAFLRKWVPVILNSPAFKKDGLLVITFDEAASVNPAVDSAACCGEEPLPGAAFPPGGNGAGGGQIGAVLLSPFIKPGTVSQQPYNHYSLLRSTEDFFGLSHLALAGAPQIESFGADIFGASPKPAPAKNGHRHHAKRA